jgi:hypothetical protein
VTTPISNPWTELTAGLTRASSLQEASLGAARGMAAILSTPIAILSHGVDGWHFESDAIPDRLVEHADAGSPPAPPSPSSTDRSPEWTGIVVGRVRDRQWLLLLPGEAGRWRGVAGLEGFLADFGETLMRVAER